MDRAGSVMDKLVWTSLTRLLKRLSRVAERGNAHAKFDRQKLLLVQILARTYVLIPAEVPAGSFLQHLQT